MNELKNALFSIFPGDRVSDDPVVLASYAADSATLPGNATAPQCVVMPKTNDEILHLIQVASRQKVPITTMARGSNIAGLSVPVQGGIVADLRLMNSILEINTDAAYALIEPGVTFHQLSHALKEKGFFCHLPTATGGSSALANYLMRPSGNFSARWDPDPITCLEVITPGKGIIRTGSASFSNAGWRARYHCFPDLTGVFTSAFGTMGIVSKGGVKIFDRGEKEAVVFMAFDEFEPAVKYMKKIVRRNVAESVTFWSWGWNLFHEMMASKEAKIPEQMLKKDQKTPPEGLPFGIASARISGYEDVVNAQIDACRKIASPYGGRFMDEAEAAKLHPDCTKYLSSYFGDGCHVKPGEESQLRAGMHLSGCLLTAEPAKVIEIEKYMWELAAKEFEPPYFFRSLPYSHGREFFFAFVVYVQGSLWDRTEYVNHVKGIYKRLYTDLQYKFGGVMFRFRKDPDFLSATNSQYGSFLKDIKHTLDPENIMNPGVLMF